MSKARNLLNKINEARLISKRRFNESLIEDLEALSGVKIKVGRNVIGGFPFDIEDQDPSERLEIEAVDSLAARGLLKLLKEGGLKATLTGDTSIVIEN